MSHLSLKGMNDNKLRARAQQLPKLQATATAPYSLLATQRNSYCCKKKTRLQVNAPQKVKNCKQLSVKGCVNELKCGNDMDYRDLDWCDKQAHFYWAVCPQKKREGYKKQRDSERNRAHVQRHNRQFRAKPSLHAKPFPRRFLDQGPQPTNDRKLAKPKHIKDKRGTGPVKTYLTCLLLKHGRLEA